VTFQDSFVDRLSALNERESYTFPEDVLPDEYRSAAVLLPFWPTPGGGVEVVFTRRPEHLPSHPGQVSFPGGRKNPEDATLIDTAMREAREELGIDPAAVRVMGRLDDAWSMGAHYIVPIVGWMDRRPEFVPCPAEVDEVIVADVETLMQPGAACTHTVELKDGIHTTPAFRWEGGYVWGITADILLELLLWVRGEPSSRGDLRLQRLMSRRS